MELELLKRLGLTGFDYSYVFLGLCGISLILLILIIIQMNQLSKLKKKYLKFMGEKEVKSFEDKIERIFEENKYLKDLSEDNKKEIRKINKDMELSYNRVGIVKYDAFKQMGGNLSFSLCLLNERKDGIILNSVHSTEGCYTYVKEIKSGICDLELSNEEKEALIEAVK